MKRIAIGSFLILLVSTGRPSDAAMIDDLLKGYRAEATKPFDPEEGKAAWNRKVESRETGERRSCAGCHGSDLRRSGKHLQTEKPIEPMAPSVNAKRLTDAAFVEKWLKRNCQWTFGRPCTAQEKGDFLTFIAGR